MNNKFTRIEIVMADVKEKIATVIYMPESRLPSVRAAAKDYGFSPSTVVEAYERLQIEGVIYSRPGAGFYVAETTAPLSFTALGPKTTTPPSGVYVRHRGHIMAPAAFDPS